MTAQTQDLVLQAITELDNKQGFTIEYSDSDDMSNVKEETVSNSKMAKALKKHNLNLPLLLNVDSINYSSFLSDLLA